MRRATALATVVLFTTASLPAEAAPNPTIASLLSVGSTVIPVAVGTALIFTGRGADEGLRFDIAMAAIGIGSIFGPSAGQLYGGGGVDALVTFILRVITGGIMLAGLGLKLRGHEQNQTAGTALAVVGGIPTGLLGIYDMYAASVSAKESRYEEGHARIERERRELASIMVCGPIPCGI